MATKSCLVVNRCEQLQREMHRMRTSEAPCGLHKESGQHSDNALSNGTVRCNNFKSMLKKIDKHQDSLFHKKT